MDPTKNRFFLRPPSGPVPHRDARIVLPLIRKLSIALVLGLSIGCSASEDGPVCHPVHGVVTLDNKPLPEAAVVFHATEPPAQSASKPLAYTDSSGRFRLTTLRSGDGAPPGKYAITVELRAQRMVGEELVRDGRNLLPERYIRPETSGLQYEVVAGDNEVPPLALRSR